MTTLSSHVGHVRLAEERRLLRIQAEGEVDRGDVDRHLADLRRVVDGGESVVVRDEVEGVALALELEVLLDRAEVVSEVGLARRLDAREDAHDGRTLAATRGVALGCNGGSPALC